MLSEPSPVLDSGVTQRGSDAVDAVARLGRRTQNRDSSDADGASVAIDAGRGKCVRVRRARCVMLCDAVCCICQS